jgi:thiosulfate/3-mercaptopyruvate sulfurtransferase
MSNFPEILTSELFNILNDITTKVIDIRPSDAYNGWRLNHENRGGHIRGAKSLPLKWTRYMDWIEMVQSKNLKKSDNIIIYGYKPEDSESVGKYFEKAGYNNIMIYKKFIDEWTFDKTLPMNKLKRYNRLVHADWVNDVINKKSPPLHYGAKTVICHAHYRNRDAYLSGHIPGAIDIDTLELESPETWNRRSAVELKDALERHGISSDTTVILYGKFMYPDNNDSFPGSAAGHIGAIRCAMIMMYAGVKDVRVLNGGFQSWKDSGFRIDTDDVQKIPVKDFGARIPSHPEIIVDTDKAREMIKDQRSDLVCVRSWPEYIGEVSGYNYIKKCGRIPGVIFGNCGSDAYHMENYRNPDHTIREYHEVEDIWREQGITPDKHLAFYCGTGWRGSEAFYNAWLMGWPNVSVYDGGWFEWSNNPENPYETGVPIDIKLEV